MKSLFKIGGVAGLALLTAVSAVAGTPTFTFERTIDYGPHCCLGNVMALVTAPNGSSLYHGDWYDDDIFYTATPLTANGTDNDFANTIEAVDTPGAWSAGGWSYQSGGLDGNTVYLGGANEADTQLFAVTQTSPGVFSSSQITGITGIYSGPSVVSANKLVIANYNTGGLQFFNISGSTATADGAEIPNPTAGTAKTLSVAYDATSGKIFAYMVDDNLTRRIDIFNSDGTAAGTSHQGTWIAGAAGTLTAAGSGVATSHNRSAQISINQEYRILIAPFRDNTSDGWDVFDISTVGATGTPYKEIRHTDLNTAGYTGTGRDITGSAVFSNGADDYLALGYWNKLTMFKIDTSAVSEWTLY